MRIFDAEPQIARDLQEESEVLSRKEAPTFTLVAARHPTLGKLVIVTAKDGSGMVVATEE
jgi:hypothetical protein